MNPRTGAADPRRWLVLAITASGLLLICIDITVLFVALPALTQALEATNSQRLWILNAYPIVVAGLLPGMGTLGDRYGHRRLFTAGLIVFGAASLKRSLCAHSHCTDHRARRSGRRRGDDDAGDTGHHPRHLQRSARALHGAGTVGRCRIRGHGGAGRWWQGCCSRAFHGARCSSSTCRWSRSHCWARGWRFRSAWRPVARLGHHRLAATAAGTDRGDACHQGTIAAGLVGAATRGGTAAGSGVPSRCTCVASGSARNHCWTSRCSASPTSAVPSRRPVWARPAPSGLELALSQYLQLVEPRAPLAAALVLLPMSMAGFVAAPLAGRLLHHWPPRALGGGGFVLAAACAATLALLPVTASHRWHCGCCCSRALASASARR